VLKGVGVELTEGCLVVIHPTFTPELAKNVNDLLNAAENAVRQSREDARNETSWNRRQKQCRPIGIQCLRRARRVIG